MSKCFYKLQRFTINKSLWQKMWNFFTIDILSSVTGTILDFYVFCKLTSYLDLCYYLRKLMHYAFYLCQNKFIFNFYKVVKKELKT